jgi:hypothetical protein
MASLYLFLSPNNVTYNARNMYGTPTPTRLGTPVIVLLEFY